MLWYFRQLMDKVVAISDMVYSFHIVQSKAVQAVAEQAARIESRQLTLEAKIVELQAQVSAITKLLAPPVAVRLVFIANVGGEDIEFNEGDSMILKAGQKQKVMVKAVDAYGNQATLDPTNPIAWGSSNPDVATLVADPSDVTGMTGLITSTGKVGTSQGTARGDAKVGPEVKEIIGLVDVEVVAGEAVTVKLEPVGLPIDPQ